MPPKRKSPAATAAPAASPRKTRSTAAGKRSAGAPSKTAKKEAAVALPPVAEQKGRKRAKKAAEVEENGGAAAGDGKRVVVEACTQCRQFKIRALKVKEDLESAVPRVSVVINPEKPRRGCLEIREEGGEVFISLLSMPRPFTAMKKLDMDEVIKDIAKKIS